MDVNDDESESLEDEKGPQDDATPTSSTIKHRRELLYSKLKGYKEEKLKRKLPVDNQMLRPEHEIKKKLITRMEEVDKENSDGDADDQYGKANRLHSRGVCLPKAEPTTATHASSLSAPPVLS